MTRAIKLKSFSRLRDLKNLDELVWRAVLKRSRLHSVRGVL
jgi:hypothetical protein